MPEATLCCCHHLMACKIFLARNHSIKVMVEGMARLKDNTQGRAGKSTRAGVGMGLTSTDRGNGPWPAHMHQFIRLQVQVAIQHHT